MQKKYNFKRVSLSDKIEKYIDEDPVNLKNNSEEGNEEEDEDEEDVIIELDRLSVLTTSKQSLKIPRPKKVVPEKKTSIIPPHIQGQILAILSAVIGSFTTIFIKKANLLSPTEQATIR
jgi:hypothetical protein